MAENQKKGRLFDLPETKGAFQVKGLTTNTEKEKFYKEIQTKSNKDMRIVNFGVKYDDGKTLFVNLQGMEQDNVYFSKRAENKGEKATTEKVAWADRFSYNREGFRLIGKNIGVKKKVDQDGKLVNDKKTLTDFDACKEIKENLKDDQSVFIKGNIDYSSFTDDKGNKKASIKLVPNQVSLCADVNFKEDGYETQNDFNQVIVFVGIDAEKNDKGTQTGRFIVSAKIVTYSTIEDMEFIVENKDLANKLRKNLKPYWAIKVNGRIEACTQVEEVNEDENWGEEDKMNKVSAPFKIEYIITGASPATIEKELYSEDKINDAIMKINRSKKAESDFGDDGDWGSAASNFDNSDEEEPW